MLREVCAFFYLKNSIDAYLTNILMNKNLNKWLLKLTLIGESNEKD